MTVPVSIPGQSAIVSAWLACADAHPASRGFWLIPTVMLSEFEDWMCLYGSFMSELRLCFDWPRIPTPVKADMRPSYLRLDNDECCLSCHRCGHRIPALDQIEGLCPNMGQLLPQGGTCLSTILVVLRRWIRSPSSANRSCRSAAASEIRPVSSRGCFAACDWCSWWGFYTRFGIAAETSRWVNFDVQVSYTPGDIAERIGTKCPRSL